MSTEALGGQWSPMDLHGVKTKEPSGRYTINDDGSAYNVELTNIYGDVVKRHQVRTPAAAKALITKHKRTY